MPAPIAASTRVDGGKRLGHPRLDGSHFIVQLVIPRCCLAICFGLLAASPASADVPAPVELLRQMAHSLRAIDYQGSYVFQSGARVDTFRIVHSAARNEGEWLTRLSGPPDLATRRGQSITVQQHGKEAVSFFAGPTARLLPLVPADASELPNSNYQLRMAGSDRVAGYESDVVDIAATDGYRYSYRLWLDKDHHLPLRAAVIDDQQRTVEQYMFVMLSIGSAPPDEGVNMAAQGRSAPVVAALAGAARWVVNDLPVGYTLRARQTMPSAGKDSEQLVFSDGLASVSAYVEPTPEPISDDVALARGAMNVYIHRDRNWRYTVLGNVPAATVQRIALSISKVEVATDSN